MKSVVKIQNHYVVKGMSVNEYAHLVGNPSCVINTYEELQYFLDEQSEMNNYCDPLWDFPLDELGEREDYDYFYVELFDGEEPRYFETLITIDRIKEVL